MKLPQFSFSRLALGLAAGSLLLAGCSKSEDTSSASSSAPATKTITVALRKPATKAIGASQHRVA